MAGADYRSCDVCGCKTFYDSNLDYDFNDPSHNKTTGLINTGEIAVLCEDCSESHAIFILARK